MSREKNETRQKILDSTLKLLEKSSVGKEVRMSDIAKDAGISRQAVYLHFPTRADLLIAVTYRLDEIYDAAGRLVKPTNAKTGILRLEAYIEAWFGYLPLIYGVVKAMMDMRDQDDAAKEAYDLRMQHIRNACETTILALKNEDQLQAHLTTEVATDILWTMLSIPTWEQYRFQCGWTAQECIQRTQTSAKAVLLKP
ncbi:MAG: TetR/AcrR family transcriptional regulator [Lentilitoribacter sp.]